MQCKMLRPVWLVNYLDKNNIPFSILHSFLLTHISTVLLSFFEISFRLTPCSLNLTASSLLLIIKFVIIISFLKRFIKSMLKDTASFQNCKYFYKNFIKCFIFFCPNFTTKLNTHDFQKTKQGRTKRK